MRRVDVPSRTSAKGVVLSVSRDEARVWRMGRAQSRLVQTQTPSFEGSSPKALQYVTAVCSVVCGTRGSTMCGEEFAVTSTSGRSGVESVPALSAPALDVHVEQRRKVEVKASKDQRSPYCRPGSRAPHATGLDSILQGCFRAYALLLPQ